MRRLLTWLVVIIIAWSLWWAFAAYGMRAGLQGWLDARVSEGWQAEVSTLKSDGYPARISTGLEDLRLADPATGLALAADRLDIEALAWWPGDVTLHLPDTPVTLASPNGKARFLQSDGLIGMRLAPGTKLELDRLGWTGGPWGIVDGRGDVLSAADLTLGMDQTDTPERYRLTVNATDLRPGDALRANMHIPADWPVTFETFALDAHVSFDRPWDRRALEDRRPQPRKIELSLAEAAWGALRLKLAADLDIDENGVPEGVMNVQAENWRSMLDLAENAGYLPPRLRNQIEQGLQTLAGLTGNSEALDLQLNFRSGFVAVGFIPLGPAPRLILR